VDADLSLEVTAPSLGGGRSEKIQEEGSDMHLKKLFIAFLMARVKRWNLGITQSDNVRHTAAVTGKMTRRARRCIASRL